MRELKFRAWAKKEKKMIYDLGTPTMIDGILYFHTDYTPMQCTGLKDKNGKEIFEGDVCVWRNNKFYVEWNGDLWGGWVGAKNHADQVPFGCNQNGGLPHEEMEITGNVYENPELLDLP